MEEEKKKKIIAYEQFLNERLKTDLSTVLEQRDSIYGQIAEYLQLKTKIEQIKDNTDCLKTKVDLGCNFYVQANIPDASRIYVCVGFGFFVEFTHTEALKFISKKTDYLNEKAESLTKDAAKIKAHIKMVLEGLREIQQLNVEKLPQHRDVL